MTINQTASLLSINDEELVVKDPAEDVRGRKVLDKAGLEIGEVDDLLVDDRERKVRFLRVAAGGFLGLGETRFLVPVDAITKVEAKAVHVDQTRDHVTSGPRYDPELVNEPHLNNVYTHYGYAPYWGMGYMNPMFPY
jgi:sporulation protein YlmC with PRC-barrel domain